jgi:GMP synthase-like glutamine amidotransferase
MTRSPSSTSAGGPALASSGQDDDWNKGILDLDVPIVGFCFDHQEIAKHYLS